MIDSSNLTDIYGNTVEGGTDEDEAVEEGGQSDPSDSEIAANRSPAQAGAVYPIC